MIERHGFRANEDGRATALFWQAATGRVYRYDGRTSGNSITHYPLAAFLTEADAQVIFGKLGRIRNLHIARVSGGKLCTFLNGGQLRDAFNNGEVIGVGIVGDTAFLTRDPAQQHASVGRYPLVRDQKGMYHLLGSVVAVLSDGELVAANFPIGTMMQAKHHAELGLKPKP